MARRQNVKQELIAGIYVFVLLLILSCGQDNATIYGLTSNKINHDLSTDNLNGKVKSIIEISWSASDSTGDMTKGEQTSEIRLEYDENGDQIYLRSYDSEGNLKNEYKYERDSLGNRVSMSAYDLDGNALDKMTYTHNELGKLKSSSWTNTGAEHSAIVYYYYDDNGFKIETMWYYPSGELGGNATFQNDAKGNEIAIKDYDSGGRLNFEYEHTYEFDEQDNWVIRVRIEEEKAVEVTEREIEYYE